MKKIKQAGYSLLAVGVLSSSVTPSIGRSNTNTAAVVAAQAGGPNAPTVTADLAAVAAGIVGFAVGTQVGWNAWGWIASHPEQILGPNNGPEMSQLDN